MLRSRSIIGAMIMRLTLVGYIIYAQDCDGFHCDKISILELDKLYDCHIFWSTGEDRGLWLRGRLYVPDKREPSLTPWWLWNHTSTKLLWIPPIW